MFILCENGWAVNSDHIERIKCIPPSPEFPKYQVFATFCGASTSCFGQCIYTCDTMAEAKTHIETLAHNINAHEHYRCVFLED